MKTERNQEEETLLRRAAIRSVRRIVVKIGTTLLTGGRPRLDQARIDGLVAEIAELKSRKISVVLVSSGAIAAGIKRLGWSRIPRSIPEKQAAAAVGQTALMQTYEEHFQKRGLLVGQVLLTQDDIRNRRRFLNARHTLLMLLKHNVTPIINENDTVVVKEIKVGDNDNLSALVTNLVEADLLVILTDVDGLHEADPRAGKAGPRVPFIREITLDHERRARGSRSPLATGGMQTKIEAAKKVAHYGIPTVIASGNHSRVLSRTLEGESLGTIILPKQMRLRSRKHWIAFSSQPHGVIRVDEGALAAMRDRGKSLLPSGIIEVIGRFAIGELVACITKDDHEFARGLVAYSSEEINKIKGAKSAEIESLLGYRSTEEVIHRDDLVVIDSAASS